MNTKALYDLYEVVKSRQGTDEEGSYTCYLFKQGIDKILKKCGEECTEMVIAAKNNNNEDLSNEICDLLYHMMVMMVERGVSLDRIMEITEERSKKIGNLKKFHVSDHNS